MTSEQNVPEVQTHQGSAAAPVQDGESQYAGGPSAPGMGQSKSSRRRRRKRKNKMEAAVSPSPSGEQSNVIPTVQATAPSAPSQPFQGNGQQGQGGSKRWKKKFRGRDRQRGSDQNPGNNADFNSGNGGFRDSHQPGNNAYKRSKGGKQQQRGARSFVGPMDHSYREVNGNFADTPPSTIDTGNSRRSGGNGRGFYATDSQPIDYSQGRAIPIPEDAPTKIFFFIEDLFFLAKIQETSRKLGVKVAFVKNDKEVIAQLTSANEEERPGLIVFDLNNTNAKPLTLIPKLKAKLKKGTSIIGFLSHLQGDLKAKATEAGCDTVMPRAAFSQNLPNLLRRYGTAEDDDNNYNQ
ncbi:response regulator [Edaphobacter albus]|uniref:response regulator n=1 Tax=Edaphobacter sp. 4G125 TaxID=2763071 RepID=UPI001648E3DA|nr:response regulator [Edaphobacter sp. 4G125]QNI37422.1 response regulator [Edaphobacter sp. 4G125]